MTNLPRNQRDRRTRLLELVAEAAEELIAAGTLTDKDGTVYRTFVVPSEYRDDLADMLASLQAIDDE